MSFPSYFEAFDARRLLADYPVGDAFVRRYSGMSRDELRALQEARFLRVMQRGWEVPFYRRLWGAAGIEPGDIRELMALGRRDTLAQREEVVRFFQWSQPAAARAESRQEAACA